MSILNFLRPFVSAFFYGGFSHFIMMKCSINSSSQSVGSMPVGVQCPISSPLGKFPSYNWDWLWCPGLSPVLVSIALPFAFHTWCFPFALICHWISIVFLLYVSPPIRSTLHLLTFKVSFQAWDRLWYPMLWSQRWNSGAHGAENLLQISALAGVEPRILASSGRGCCH